jgi:ABC-type sugar transport system ATPase subunit
MEIGKQPELLSCDGITKAFGSNLAVSGVSLVVASGETVALVGSNGSGKSTLMKIIYGTVIPDSGCTKINGDRVKPGSPHQSRERGVEMVFQDKDEESRLCPVVSVLENLFLGREPMSRWGLVRVHEMKERAGDMVRHYTLSLPPLDAQFGRLSGGQQKAVAIGRALLSGPRILLLDEPTASLGVTERGFVHQALLDLKSLGVGILLCSHSLQEVMLVADRVAALRSGELIANERISVVSETEIALFMSK